MNDSYFIYQLPPGIHKIAVESRAMEASGGININMIFERAKTYYFRQDMNMTSSPGLSLVLKEEAIAEMPILKDLTD
jgi:hypothetical protein